MTTFDRINRIDGIEMVHTKTRRIIEQKVTKVGRGMPFPSPDFAVSFSIQHLAFILISAWDAGCGQGGEHGTAAPDAMPPSKWQAFIGPVLVGFDRPRTLDYQSSLLTLFT